MWQVTLTKIDHPEKSLSTGVSVDLFVQNMPDAEVLEYSLASMVADDVSVVVQPAQLSVTYVLEQK